MFRIALTREIGLVPKNFRFSNALGRNAQMNVRFTSSKMNVVAPRSRVTALTSKSGLSGKEMVLRRNERSLATVAQTGKDWYQTPLYHYSSYALIGLFPAGLLLSPSAICLPIDLALGFAIPLHAHMGIALVIDDYIPKTGNAASHMILWAVSILMTLGFLRLNLSGDGISASFKSLWKPATVNIHDE